MRFERFFSTAICKSCKKPFLKAKIKRSRRSGALKVRSIHNVTCSHYCSSKYSRLRIKKNRKV